MNSYRIVNWRMRGDGPSKMASFMYISYCDTITTQIYNSTERSDFASTRLCCINKPGQKNTSLCPVWVPTPPRQSCSVFRTGLEPHWTVFPVWTRTAHGLPGHVANTSYMHWANPWYGGIIAQSCLSLSFLESCSSNNVIQSLKRLSIPRKTVRYIFGLTIVVRQMHFIFNKIPSEVATCQSSRQCVSPVLCITTSWVAGIILLM